MSLEQTETVEIKEAEQIAGSGKVRFSLLDLAKVAERTAREAKETAIEREQKIYAQNPFVCELIVGNFDTSIPVFFEDEKALHRFVMDWDSLPPDATITASNVRLKSDFERDGQACVLKVNKSAYTGIKYPFIGFLV